MCATWLWRRIPRRVRGVKTNHYTFILPNKVNTELNFSATWPLRSQAASLWVKFGRTEIRFGQGLCNTPPKQSLRWTFETWHLKKFGHFARLCRHFSPKSWPLFFVCKLFGIELCVVHFPSWEKRHFIQITWTFTCSGGSSSTTQALFAEIVVAVWHQDSPGNRRNSLSDGGKCTTTRSLKCLCYESKIASPITSLLFWTTRWDKIAKITETHGAPSHQQRSVSFSLWAGKVIMGSFSLEKVSPEWERERDCLKIYSPQHWENVHVMCMCRLDIKLSNTKSKLLLHLKRKL